MRYLLSMVLVSVILLPGAVCYGSGLTFSNLRQGALDYSGGSMEVIFDLTWDGSWRTSSGPSNWDAVWVFLRFRKNGGAWEHARLNANGTHRVPSTALLSTGLANTSLPFNVSTNPGVGVFVYRSVDGSGSFSVSGATLSWNYGANGVVAGDVIDVKVFGVEMVYIPEGAFYAGDNAMSYADFRQGDSDYDPWYISSEAALTTSNSAGNGTGAGQMTALYYNVAVTFPNEDPSWGNFYDPAVIPKGVSGLLYDEGGGKPGRVGGIF